MVKKGVGQEYSERSLLNGSPTTIEILQCLGANTFNCGTISHTEVKSQESWAKDIEINVPNVIGANVKFLHVGDGSEM